MEEKQAREGSRAGADAMCLAAWTLAGILLVLPAEAAPYGRVVSIGGQAADLALDEARGVLYVANFTANRIDVISLGSASVDRSMNVAPQPSSLAVSPGGRWLAVTHFGNYASPNAPRNALTLIDLNTSARSVYALTSAPLGVAFGADGIALVVTETEFLAFDPETGISHLLDTIQGLAAKTLPQPPASFPPNIVAASVATSRDGQFIFGLTDTIRFRYDVAARKLFPLGYVASPAFGPRAVSVNWDGSYYTAGWALFNRAGRLMAQFPDPAGLLNVGGHVYDTARGVIYSQVPDSKSGTPTDLPPPVLQIVDAQNFAVQERLELAENLAGKGVMSNDSEMAYVISDSGVTFLPVGQLPKERRVTALQEDVIVHTNSCDRGAMTAELGIADISAQNTSFTLSSSIPGVRLSPSSGQTPAVVQIFVDPVALGQSQGMVTGTITISAPQSVRIPDPVRLIIHMNDPDQRGVTVHIPGKLVDLVADPIRDRYYVLRQDRNQVLVFIGTTNQQIATWKTGNTPTQMAFTMDRRYLLVGNDNSQIANVYDLETLEPKDPIIFPGGHYPRSIAASGGAILAATRVAGPQHKIDSIDFTHRIATELPALGVWDNNIHLNTVLVAAPNGSSIMAAQADGNLLLYNATSDSFTVSRRDTEKLGGAYAASSFDRFVIGNALMNSSLVTVRRMNPQSTTSTGFVFADQAGFRNTSGSILERVDAASGASMRPTRLAEPPLAGDTGQVFSRSLALLWGNKGFLNLTTSGITRLPWDYDAGAVPPRISKVVNGANGNAQIATGSLITIFGADLSSMTLSSSSLPLPHSLAGACLLVNGAAAPLYYVSSNQINAQLPYTVEGTINLKVYASGGVSDNFTMTVAPAAPGLFYLHIPGLDTPTPAIYNGRNGGLATGSNPVKRGDRVVIYLTGMGKTSPEVDAGSAAPAEPLAQAILPPSVTLGGVGLALEFAGLTPGSAGVYQINALISWNVPLGLEIPMEINQGATSTTVHMRVID